MSGPAVLDFPPGGSGRALPEPAPPPYAELMATSNFSFLEGGSHPEELAVCAASLGLKGFGLCDRNSFAGVVRAFVALRDWPEDNPPLPEDFRYVIGTRLVFADGTPDILAYPSDRAAYGRLCRLLTRGNMRAGKGRCQLGFDDLAEYAEGQLFVLHVDETAWARGETTLAALAALAPGRVWLAAACTYGGQDRLRLNRLADLAGRMGVPMLAVNNVLYHCPERRPLQDVLTCIREHLTLFEAGRRLEKNAERHLKSPREMARLFREHPEAVAETARLLARIRFRLSDLSYAYPDETTGTGETAQETLERLTWEGAEKRYPEGVPEKIKLAVWSELALIAYKRYAAYFLTVHDIVRFAREERGILCQGRGSAANSAVCYCLGVTEVDPMVANLVFSRFLSTERDEPPDIDVDFEHERREEVMQYLYGKYGRDRAGLTATVVTYRSKGALREVAKAFGLSTDTIEAMNGLSWGSYSGGPTPEQARQLNLDPADPTLAKVLALSAELYGFPRHLSQHVGGFVLTKDRLDDYIPITKAAMEDRTVVEWNKDDLDAVGLLKVDVLALGMLSCIRRAFDLMHSHYRLDLTLAGILAEEGADKKLPVPERKSPRVYAMTHRADTLGVFQIESRAQMSMLPRLRPEKFYDLVIEVAIVRPGPIQGGMVHPYLKRRLGQEEPHYHSPELQDVLERTFGVPLFQEQAMQIAIVAAGFSPAEADRLRRAMATWRRNGNVKALKAKFLAGMKRNGYPDDFAQACFRQIEGFGEYGFPESHAASFALLVYVSCWLKCHYPDVFGCALLNSQPMGFYQPAQIVRDVVEHGIKVLPVDINLSDHDSLLADPEGHVPADHIWKRHEEMKGDIRGDRAIRLGLRFVKGLGEDDANKLMARRIAGPFASVRDLWLRTGLSIAALEKLAQADAFGSIGLSRREALWAVRGLIGTDSAQTLPLFQKAGLPPPQPRQAAGLPEMTPGEAVVHDYKALSLSLKAHPLSFLRPMLARHGVVRAQDLMDMPPGRMVEVAGLVLVRQRPGTASGVVFATLEDETGIANAVIWQAAFEANRKIIIGARLMGIRGPLQREGLVVHVVARQFVDYTAHLLALAAGQDIGPAALARADEGRSGPPGSRDEAQRRREEMARRQANAALPQGRNFH